MRETPREAIELNPPQAAEVVWDWEAMRQRCMLAAERMLGSRSDAEEAVQEALIRAWRFRTRCDHAHAPLPWVLQITQREALRLLQRRARERLCDRQVIELPFAEPVDGPGDPLLRLFVAGALKTLTADERRLIALRYVDDLSQPEIARTLGVPEGTAKVRLHRVRARLRMAMEIGDEELHGHH